MQRDTIETQQRRAAASNEEWRKIDKKLWLKVAAGWSFFVAVCQTVISLSPAAAAYFRAPPPLLCVGQLPDQGNVGGL
jgi:hypothetical protein